MNSNKCLVVTHNPPHKERNENVRHEEYKTKIQKESDGEL